MPEPTTPTFTHSDAVRLVRPFLHSDAVRLAALVAECNTTAPVSRDWIVDEWTRRWPASAISNGRRTLRRRVVRCLALLRSAGVLTTDYDGAPIRVLDRELVELVASNASVVIGPDGRTLEPVYWTRPPAVPAHLVLMQALLEVERQRQRHVSTADDPHATMTVRVRDESAEAPWGSGPTDPAVRTVTISAFCPVDDCGRHRGKPRNLNQSEDGAYFSSDIWTNPCGHTDYYTAVVQEARELAAALAAQED